jgi:hypothetical protein
MTSLDSAQQETAEATLSRICALLMEAAALRRERLAQAEQSADEAEPAQPKEQAS